MFPLQLVQATMRVGTRVLGIIVLTGVAKMTVIAIAQLVPVSTPAKCMTQQQPGAWTQQLATGCAIWIDIQIFEATELRLKLKRRTITLHME